MTKSKLKLKKSSKSKSNRSLFLGIVILVAAVIMVFAYATSTTPPLIAGVLDDYELNTTKLGADGQTIAGRKGGRDAEKEAVTNPEKFKADNQAAKNEGAAAVAAANTAKKKALAEGKTAQAAANAAANAATEAIKEVKDTGTYVAKNTEEKQIYDSSINTSNAAIAAETAFLDKMKSLNMSRDEQLDCIGDDKGSTNSESCQKAHIEAGTVYAQFITGINSASGASCASGSPGVGIGSGQWAQTGRGLDKNGKVCSASGCAFRECVQCVDGVYNNSNRQTCGQGSATSYITRPDEVIDCKANPGLPTCNGSSAKSNCWKNGAYYADSSSFGGESCNNGNWGPVIKETDTVITAANIQAQMAEDAVQSCKAAGKTTPDSSCASEKNYNAWVSQQSILKYGSGGSLSTSTNNAAALRLSTIIAVRPNTFTGGVSNTTYKDKKACDQVARTGETCIEIPSSLGSGYKIYTQTTLVPVNIGNGSPSAPVDPNKTYKSTAKLNQYDNYAIAPGTISALDQCNQDAKKSGAACEPAGQDPDTGLQTYKIVSDTSDDVSDSNKTNDYGGDAVLDTVNPTSPLQKLGRIFSSTWNTITGIFSSKDKTVNIPTLTSEQKAMLQKPEEAWSATNPINVKKTWECPKGSRRETKYKTSPTDINTYNCYPQE